MNDRQLSASCFEFSNGSFVGASGWFHSAICMTLALGAEGLSRVTTKRPFTNNRRSHREQHRAKA
jgi:hypothetical protein